MLRPAIVLTFSLSNFINDRHSIIKINFSLLVLSVVDTPEYMCKIYDLLIAIFTAHVVFRSINLVSVQN